VEEVINKVLAQSGGNGYAFLVDAEGDAVFHPDFKASPTLRFFDVELMETLVNTEDFLATTRKATDFYASVRRCMIDGTRGTRKLTVTRNYLPCGLYNMDVTYFFMPIDGTPFSVATVWPSNNIQQLLFPDDINGGWNQNLVYADFTPYVEDKDLVPTFEATRELALHEGENMSLTHGTVSFVPDLYCDAAAAYDVTAIAHDIIRLLNATSNINCSTDGVLDPYFVRPSVRLASKFIEFWMEGYSELNISNFSSFLYFADQHGTSAFFPGMEIPFGFDARERLWYRRALVANGVASVSTPYIGVSTEGRFYISLAEAIVHNGVPLGVVGSDVELPVLQNTLYNISDGNCEIGGDNTRCYIIDSFGYLVHSPRYDLAKLVEECNGNYTAVEQKIKSRFLGTELGPVVLNMVEDGVLIPRDVVVTNKVCTEEIENDDGDDDDDDDDDSNTMSPAPRLKPVVDDLLNIFSGKELKKERKRSTTTTKREWPCLYHQTYYEMSKDFFDDNNPVYLTLVSHPRMVGTVTVAPIPNTTVYLLVFQGRVDGLSANDVVDTAMEPLGHEDLIAQRNVDRRGALCPSDVERECLTCPGLNETGFICNGRGDCIDGYCHCPDNNATDYCLEYSAFNSMPSLSLSLALLSLFLVLF